MVLKITNLHILRYLPTCWLYLLERYTIDNQRCTHTASIRIYLITPFEEAYEIRYMATDNQNCYQSEPIPILYSKDEHESSKTQVTQIKQYSIHGGIQGTIKDNFPEVARELDD